MKTNWMHKEVSTSFDLYDDSLEEMLGYNPLIERMKLSVGYDDPIIDYGCGGGKVSYRLKESGFKNITGVDISNTMIEKSNKHRAAKEIKYHLIKSGVIPVESESFSAAICCYLFINIHTKLEFQSIVNEIYRCLKPGAIFYTLDTNPSSTGVQFTTFVSGEEGIDYTDGGERKVILELPNNNKFIISDTHWNKSTYYELFGKAGFHNIQSTEITLYDIPPETINGCCEWGLEYTRPPFILFSAVKPS